MSSLRADFAAFKANDLCVFHIYIYIIISSGLPDREIYIGQNWEITICVKPLNYLSIDNTVRLANID